MSIICSGLDYRKTGKWADALAFYKRALALELEPKHVGANEYLGELYLEQGAGGSNPVASTNENNGLERLSTAARWGDRRIW